MNAIAKDQWGPQVEQAFEKARAKGLPPAKNFLGHVDGSMNVGGYEFEVTYDVYGYTAKPYPGNRFEPPEQGGVVVEQVFVSGEEITNALDDYAIYQLQVCIEDMET